MRIPTERGTRVKITNLKSGKFLLKHDKNHCLHYFFGARLFNGELLTYADILHNQVFTFKNETWLIEIISKSEADALIY